MTDLDATTPTCVICGYELWEQRTACTRCEDGLRDQLNELEHLWLQLPAHLERGTTNTDRVSSSRTPGIPPNLEVLDLTSRGGIVTKLQVHEDDWRKARGFTKTPWRGNPDQTLPAVIRFLRNNLTWACTHYSDPDDLARDLAPLIGRCRTITTGETRERSFTAYCDQANCAGEMRIRLSTHNVTCPQCGHHHNRTQITTLDTEFGPNPNRRSVA